MTKKIWTYIISALCIIGGLYLIINPQLTFTNLVYYIGLIILIIGIIKVLSALINRENFFLPGNYLFSGIINSLFGIILMTNASSTVKVIPIIIGLWLIISSASGLALILNVKRNNNTINNSLLVNHLIKLIIGIIVLTTPIITIVFTGWFLGIILLLIGIYLIVNSFPKQKTYKVKVK